MGYDGAGNYTRQRNFSADASAGIKILASAMDQELDDVASAMTLPLLRDGQNSPTADIPMGGYRLTNVGGPASASNYIRASEFISNIPIYMIDSESSADRVSVSASYFTTASANASPAGGTHVLVKMGSNKGSAPVMYLNTGDGNPHSANIWLNYSVSAPLYSGALMSGGIYEFVFASAASVWKLMNPTVRQATTDTPGVIEIATTAETSTGTDVLRAITPRLLKRYLDVATTASAGRIEVATTAEVTAGTGGGAVTPSALSPVLAQVSSNSVEAHAAYSAIPLLARFVASPTTADITITSKNFKASALTLVTVGQGQYRINYGIDLANASAGVVHISLVAAAPGIYKKVDTTSVGISTCQFLVTDLSGSAASATVTCMFSLHKVF